MKATALANIQQQIVDADQGVRIAAGEVDLRVPAVLGVDRQRGDAGIDRDDAEEVDVMPLSTQAEMENLVQDMTGGKISVIIHMDTNPVFHLPDRPLQDWPSSRLSLAHFVVVEPCQGGYEKTFIAVG